MRTFYKIQWPNRRLVALLVSFRKHFVQAAAIICQVSPAVVMPNSRSQGRHATANQIPPTRETSLSVLWVTNLAAPYRRPVWKVLAARHRITVALLESNESLIRDSSLNRGQDWRHDFHAELLFRELPSWKYSRGEARFYTLKRFRDVFAVRKYDVVLFGGWESPAYWALLVASLLWRNARVGFYESPLNTMTHSSGPVALLRKAFFRSMTRIVVPGPAAHDAILKMGVPAVRILQGFNAVDVTAFHQAAESAAGGTTGHAVSGHRFLYVGQLISRKRVREIVTAFIHVAQPQDELTIVGTGELLGQLSKVAKAKDARISFLGHVTNSDMPEIMASHHTLILASGREVWGLVVNEALATGMHVVVTANCGVARSVAHMRGVYTSTESLQDLEEQMQLSRAEWDGRIENPEILEYTPQRFAAVFGEAFVAAHRAATRTRLGGRWRL